jgi:hypothetical protein
MTGNLTYDEVVNSYEFKLTEKILKREFPWIEKIDIREDELTKYKMLFLDIYIDPYKLAEEKEWKIKWYNVRDIHRGSVAKSPYLSTLFDIFHEEGKELTEEIEDILSQVKKSPAVPIDLKLPKDRNFAVGAFITSPNLQIPPNAEEYEEEYKRD